METTGKMVFKKARADVIKTLKKWNGKLIEIPYTKGISSTQLNDELKTIVPLLIPD